MNFIPSIKRRWLRRIVMVAAATYVPFEYMYIGLKMLKSDFKVCWDYQHPPEA